MRLSDSKYGLLLSTPGLVIILALIIFPIVTLFVTSFLRYTSFHPVSWGGLRNYIYILNDRIFWMALKQTAVYTFGVTALTFICGVALALALSNIKRGAAVFRSLAMFSWAVPLVISGFIWKWIFNPNVGVFSDILMKIGMIDAPLPVFSDPSLAMVGCIVADAWVRIPFMCIFILAGVESISEEVYDAAKIDGADCISTFWYITMPLIRNMALVGLLITSMFTFRTIDVIYSMTEGGPAKGTYVLGIYIVDQIWKRVNFGASAAAGVIMFVLIGVFAGIYVYNIFKEEE
jgi:multiple sugar transport system permease protein